MTAADGDRGGAGALGEAEREAMDRFDRAHGYPTETDDGLVMKCHCEATPPSHLLGQQVDEALWLWRHHQAEQYATVARIRDAAVAAERERIWSALIQGGDSARRYEQASNDEGVAVYWDGAADALHEVAVRIARTTQPETEEQP